jgi:hypothetical protein
MNTCVLSPVDTGKFAENAAHSDDYQMIILTCELLEKTHCSLKEAVQILTHFTSAARHSRLERIVADRRLVLESGQSTAPNNDGAVEPEEVLLMTDLDARDFYAHAPEADDSKLLTFVFQLMTKTYYAPAAACNVLKIFSRATRNFYASKVATRRSRVIAFDLQKLDMVPVLPDLALARLISESLHYANSFMHSKKTYFLMRLFQEQIEGRCNSKPVARLWLKELLNKMHVKTDEIQLGLEKQIKALA